MKLLSKKQTEVNLYELEVQVEESEFAVGLEKSYKKNAPKLNIPGFRKGKAPKAMVLKMAGEEYFYNDAINETYFDAYEAAVKEAGLTPVSRPEIEVGDVTHAGYVFTAKIVNKPVAEVEGYKGIEAERSFVAVTEPEIEQELRHVAERNSRLVEITDRAAEDGDTAEIDFEGFADGKAFDGGKGENYPLILGSGQFIPGFEEQIVGHSVGESFDVNVTFPEAYQEKKLAGRPAVFKVTLNALKKKEYPAIDDELAKDVSEFETLDEYKADIRKKLLDSKNKMADDQLEKNLVSAAAAKTKVEIPEAMIVGKIDDMLGDMDYRLRMQGMSLEQYMKYANMTVEQLRQDYREPAVDQIRTSLTLEKIAEVENLEVSEEEIETELQKTADLYKMELEKVRELVSADKVAEQLKIGKAVDLIKDNAKVTQKTAADGDAPKKAPAKKKTAKAAASGEDAVSEEAEVPEKKAPARKKAAKAADSGEDAVGEEAEVPEKKAPARKKAAKTDENKAE